MSVSEILLHADRLRVRVSPEIGGSIASFSYQDESHAYPVLRCATGLLQSPLDAASFPLVPYCNRIRDGMFHFEGEDIHIPPNMAGERHPLHGQGWLSAWQLLEATSTQAILRYHHAADAWPWDYEARQHFTLDAQGLEVQLSCRNLSARPMPCGLGFHPYFPVTPTTHLQAALSHVWLVDDDILPTQKTALTAHSDPNSGPIWGRGLDNGYDGWPGIAHIRDPQWPFDLMMCADNAGYFQIYAPATLPLLVAEPVTHANAALNAPAADWAALGIKILAPEETQELRWRLDVLPKAIWSLPDAGRE